MIRKLAPYTKGYRIWIILGVLCSAGEAVLELLLPKAMSQIVDVGIANGDKEYILAMGLKMILMALASLVMGVGAAALAARAHSWVWLSSSQQQRVRIPVRETIHWSLVSTRRASSSLVTIRRGRLRPVPRSLIPFMVPPFRSPCAGIFHIAAGPGRSRSPG